jgi:uncharacterized membrane protein
MVVRKDLFTVISLTISVFIIGVIPWVLLLFVRTKNSVHWLGELGFQYWGWLLVFCLAGYAFLKTIRLNTISKITKATIAIFLLSILGWSLFWALLIISGLLISNIV